MNTLAMLDTILIANPQSPRVEFFQNALASLDLAPAQLVTYKDLLVRLGRSPMTNLPLGSDRRSVAPVRDRLRPADWDAMMHTCERAAACFPKSLYCGVDLLIAPNWNDH